MIGFLEIPLDRTGATLRKPMIDDIQKLARGRVYTGQIAKSKGLIDEIGGLDQAIVYAAEKAKVKDYQIRVLPKPKNLMDLFKKSLSHDDDDDVNVSAAGSLPISSSAMQILAPLMKQLDPAKAKMISRFLLNLDMLAKENVLTVMPNEFTVNGMGW